jgi:cathepsin L
VNDLPNADIDWTAKGGVTSVKNQGQCGSCWAFAATATSESWALIKTKTTYDLSEQQLIDCSTSYGNQGCNGGWPASALKYIVANGITA